jgi:hypothetical protein
MGHSISGWPRTGSKGLGVWSVKGRMRSPRPAASTMAWASGLALSEGGCEVV